MRKKLYLLSDNDTVKTAGNGALASRVSSSSSSSSSARPPPGARVDVNHLLHHVAAVRSN